MFVKTAQTQTAHAQSFAEAKRSQFTETTLPTIERQHGARPFEMTKSQGNFHAEELRGAKDVVLQQMELNGMASENHGDQRAATERETVKDSRPFTKPSAPSGPPILNDGPELPRSSHC